jgi:hypothetical protein
MDHVVLSIDLHACSLEKAAGVRTNKSAILKEGTIETNRYAHCVEKATYTKAISLFRKYQYPAATKANVFLKTTTCRFLIKKFPPDSSPRGSARIVNVRPPSSEAESLTGVFVS